MVRAKVATVLVLVGVTAAPLAPPAGAGAAPTYRPPVDAPITDPFRAPEHRYGPGNRGLEYATGAGDVVVASADGRVVFAGHVAGTRHVTLLHADGLRTSYSFLASISVGLVQQVRGGEPVGTAGETFHFSVRLGDEYLDPQSLFAGDRPTAHLVPVAPEPSGAVLAAERAALWDIAAGAFETGWSALGQQAAPWLHYLRALPAPPRVASVVANVVRRRLDQRRCTPSDRPVRPFAERRVVVLVAGLSSSSDSGSVDEIDPGRLGYRSGDVVRFSYAGGQVEPGAAHDPSWGSNFAELPSSGYDAVDTEDDLRRSGARLLALLQAVSRAAPGVPIDVIAHSQGGVVARVALAQGAADGLPREVEHVLTLGTPHGGADLATAAAAIGRDADGARALAVAGDQLGLELDPAATSVAQLAETSTLIEELAAADPPPQVRLRSIAARGDLIVPVPRTRWSGAEHAVVSVPGLDDHTMLPRSPAARREVALALADAPPSCEGLLDTVADQLGGEAVSWAEDLVGARLAGLCPRRLTVETRLGSRVAAPLHSPVGQNDRTQFIRITSDITALAHPRSPFGV